MHQPGPVGHQPQPFLKAEHTRKRAADVLAQAVTQDPDRLHPEPTPQFGQRILQHVQGRLRIERLVEQLGRLRVFPPHHRPQRHLQLICQRRFGLFNNPPEAGRAGVECPAHAGILRALARKQQTNPGPAPHFAPSWTSAP